MSPSGMSPSGYSDHHTMNDTLNDTMNDTIGMNSCCSHEEKMSDDFVVITSEEEEDWFVGDHVIDHIVGDHVVGDEHGLNPSSNGCYRSVGNIRTTLFPHPEPEQTPESVLLTPLEGYDNNNRERCERPWDDAPRDTPPAGQSTSEKNQEEGSPNRNNVIHVIPRTAMVDVPNRTLDASNDFHNTATNTTLANTTTITTTARIRRRKRRQFKREMQGKLAAAVFAHPYSLRTYCLDAYATALQLSMEREREQRQTTTLAVTATRAISAEDRVDQVDRVDQDEHPVRRETTTRRERVVQEVRREAREETMIARYNSAGQFLEDSPDIVRHYPTPLSRSLHGSAHHGSVHDTSIVHASAGDVVCDEAHFVVRRIETTNLMEDLVEDNIALSLALELTESACDLSIRTFFASACLSSIALGTCTSLLAESIRLSATHVRQSTTHVANALGPIVAPIARVNLNPFRIFQCVVNAPRSAMGKTGDVLVSGIQSVATGVGSVSNAALNRLSRQGLALAGGVVGNGTSRSGTGRSSRNASHSHHHHHHHGGMGIKVGMVGGRGRKTKDRGVVEDNILESKLFHRLHKMENVSKLIDYSERTGEEAFSQHAKKRAQRMMHYNVSFRPFTATIQPSSVTANRKSNNKTTRSNNNNNNVSFDAGGFQGSTNYDYDDGESVSESVSSDSQNSSGSSSIFMRTPTSFPPTPTSRLYYFDRGSRFTENVVFLARDQLRVERGVGNHNEQTRAMSKALIDGSRLVVFDAAQAGSGIALSCGQHIATKVGNSLYCSARSMIPVMRNSYVYFEISVSPPPPTAAMGDASGGGGGGGGSMLLPQVVDAATLSVGLSTLALPLDTLVGVCKGSVGLCSTGQILHAGQWLSPSSVHDSSYGSNSTVGCLVYLDDSSAYDTSEGQWITADVTFNINGMIVPSTLYNVSSGDQIIRGSTSKQSLLGENGNGGEPTLSLIVDKTRELFPTVTLHSPATCVMCRFSAEDMLANTRSEIGALSGVIVYAVDGSVILDESDDDDFRGSSSPCNDFFRGNAF